MLKVIQRLLTKTVVRIDELTGNFSVFQKSLWWKTKHYEFSLGSAVPTVLTRTTDAGEGSTIVHELRIYPSQAEADKYSGPGNADKSVSPDSNIFVSIGWNQERCHWVNNLIRSIQNRGIQDKDRELLPESSTVSSAGEFGKDASETSRLEDRLRDKV